eukprot:2700291-Amphidinium_carterae.1
MTAQASNDNGKPNARMILRGERTAKDKVYHSQDSREEFNFANPPHHPPKSPKKSSRFKGGQN